MHRSSKSTDASASSRIRGKQLMKGAEKIRWITPTKSPTNPEQLPRRHLPTFPQGAMSSPTVPDRPTDRPGCEDTADRARAQIKLDQEDHGQSVTSPATPRIPVVAGRFGWWCSCSDPGAIDQSIVQPAAVPGRKLSRSLTVTHVRSGERRPPVAGGRAASRNLGGHRRRLST